MTTNNRNELLINTHFQANEKNRLLQENIEQLHSEKERLIEAMQILSTEQNNLKKNISSLYLTAKTELDRKNRIITELRTELEDLKFRRVGTRKWQHSSAVQRPAKASHSESESSNYANPEVKRLEGTSLLRNVQENIVSETLEQKAEHKYVNLYYLYG